MYPIYICLLEMPFNAYIMLVSLHLREGWPCKGGFHRDQGTLGCIILQAPHVADVHTGLCLFVLLVNWSRTSLNIWQSLSASVGSM